jgi:sulfur carrier protein ThiS
MAIQVTWFPTLIKRTHSKQAKTEVAWRAGLTPLAVFKDEGFNEADAEAVMVIINDAQADAQDALNDGDRLEFMVSIQGGASD